MNAELLKHEIVNALATPAMLLNTQYRIITSNQTARSLFEHELTGTDFVRVLRSPDVLSCLGEALSTDAREQVKTELRFTTRRTFEVAAAPLHIGDEKFLLLTMMDVSAEIAAERSRSTVVANVSHELRSPLTTLMGVVETLQGPARNDVKATASFLDLMSGEVQRMSRLVGDLLSLSKLEAKEHVAPKGRVDMATLIGSVASSLSAGHPEYVGRIQIDEAPNMPSARGDHDELTEVFQNLIENALKYSTPASPIIVSLTQSQDNVRVVIADQGEGIEKKHLYRLTERFYRVDKGRSREMGGTGLGLAITKHIINRHRGRFIVDSEVGVGTTVTVTLPISG